MQVWASMRDTSMGESLEEITSDEHLDLRVIQLDVEDEQSVAKAFGHIGGVDVLVNNAGLSPVGSVEEFDLAAWTEASVVNKNA